MKVLIVEDDAALGLFLQRGLKLDGHEVDWVGDGEAALAQLSNRSFDLVVLDLGLPRKDGVEVLTELRGRCQRTAVLVLSGRSDVEEKVKCLNLGADDCLLKPFSFHELRARCGALLRRREQFADPVLRHEGVELNRMSRRVTCEGRRVELTGKEFSLLEYLLERRGQCCSRSELLREVWEMAPDAGTNVVDVYINYLRKKLSGPDGLEDAAGDPVIETVRGAGYMIGGVGGKKPVRSDVLFGQMPLRMGGQMAGA
ncbi:response regulator transcription factor [Granulicella arctica]|uniref:DNA-binding response OmpR family regulator n=1 Tax=Granulicella arctica TaxID=940613 RepID=A0A7Y9PHZ8_9BACT|nr:response regulator transcription factor [Granulicella arctica]NYF80191.1 DNA-binding response OmpR family regulator [Granulicella arctica]